jgi:20S proteasome alpha/beta subunit
LTCIVGFATRDYAIMAADRAVLDKWHRWEAGDPKIGIVSGWLVGASGPCRVGNALIHMIDALPIPDGGIVTPGWLHRTFMPTFRLLAEQTQFIVVDGWIGGKESPQSASLIFAGYGITFSVTEDWAAEPSAHGYVAIGSGREQAVGAMCALNSYFKETHTEPIDLTQAKLHCQLAVDAACRHDVFCRGPVDILTVQRGEL